MRTLAIAIALSIFLPACDDGDKPPKPETAAPEQPAAPAPAPAGEVRKLTPAQVEAEVNRAAKEHTDKIDEALDVE